MAGFFIYIYKYFRSHRFVMWATLSVLVFLMSLGAINIKYEEDLSNFFPDQQQELSSILSSLKASNRFVVLLSSDKDGEESHLMNCADELAAKLEANEDFAASNATISLRIDEERVDSIRDFIYSNLPIFLDESDYERLENLNVEEKMKENYALLSSTLGGYIGDYIYRDPLGIASSALNELQTLGAGFNYNILDGYIFSKDGKTLMFYIDPKGEGGDHSELVEGIESIIKSTNKVLSAEQNEVLNAERNEGGEIKIQYFAAPAVAYYNAKQIKWDSMVTLNIAILIVAIFIFFAFRNWRNVALLLAPVLFGVLFSLSLVYIIQGGVSLIAVGSGSIIFGLAFSYAIHFISHSTYLSNTEKVIEELVFPLSVGSITTIGAFAGLLFTNSKMLQDFGLFSALALIGTSLFTLIFLPQFIHPTKNDAKKENRVLGLLYDFVGKKHENNKILVYSILLLALVSALFFNQAGFESNMMSLNYMPQHLAASEQALNEFINKDDGASNIAIIASAPEAEQAISRYRELNERIDSLRAEGLINSYSNVSKFVVSDSLQRSRLQRWQEFWGEGRWEQMLARISKSEESLGFEEGAFSQGEELLKSSYSPIDYRSQSSFAYLFEEWLSLRDSQLLFISQIQLADSAKQDVYASLAELDGVIAADRAYFASMMSEEVSENFYLVLYISGLLIFAVLLLSYGRIELALIAFSPMFIAWLIIIGLMSLLGIQFNIVTIILSTFIFGIGDDFSIFVMDGLLGNYKDGSAILNYHKRAIFISALSLIVGMGALVFARHPAMYSLGVVSLIGMFVVVLVSYTVQPLLFRLLISKHTPMGGFPFTLSSLCVTIYAFGVFVVACFAVQLLIAFSRLFIWERKRREEFIHSLICFFANISIKFTPTVKRIKINEGGERFEKPAVIIANHQSFIDILLLLGLNRKFVMVTNSWVWNNAFFGRIVRFLGFFHVAQGYENSIEALRQKVELGYSIVVFPEGTRSADASIQRFHKGAFYIAEQLSLDIIPVLIYGAGFVSSKTQALYIKHGLLVCKVLARIKAQDKSFGEGYAKRSKAIRRYFIEENDKLYEEFNRASNPYFRDAIIKNYIYKGAVLEWYMRIKLRIEKWYDLYDRLLPREGHIVDLGCGYGAMSYMLLLLSHKRRIVAIDYDEQKIALAANCFVANEKIEFQAADIRLYEIPEADAYVISDVLHYIDKESQIRIIESCISRLKPRGVILIREGDSSQQQNHRNTEATERWSTKYIKFNKTDGELNFISQAEIFEVAHKNEMNIAIVASSQNTSNKLYKITHKDGE